MENSDIDPLLRELGSRGRYQVLQMILISVGGWGAAYQLFDNIFIGRDVPFRCAAPTNYSEVTVPDHLRDVIWNSSHVQYDQCHMIVTRPTAGIKRNDNTSDNLYSEHNSDCIFGYHYEWKKDASFVSDFGLVCDRYLLASLAQTMVVLGQGFGAFIMSIVSDRFGRKPVLLGCQLLMFASGVAIGLSPSFPFLAVFKVVAGFFQQATTLADFGEALYSGVVTGIATMGIELFPQEARSLNALLFNLLWAVGTCSMALISFLLRHQSWRVLQYTLSAASLATFLLQLWLVDESLRWLIANGRVNAALSVLKRASRANHKDLNTVLDKFHQYSQHRIKQAPLLPDGEGTSAGTSVRDKAETESDTDLPTDGDGQPVLATVDVKKDLESHRTQQLTILDIFRHKRLLLNTVFTLTGWFTVSFVFFTLILMSTSYAGDPYLNYFLAALMDVPPCLILYFLLDRLGRKRTVQLFFGLAGFGVLSSAICRAFTDNSTLAILATALSLVGVVGGSGAFAGVFFYTPEYFPTNLRSQAIGFSSTVGRVGGMIAPFMKNLALVVIWGPGVITGSLCVIVLLLYCLLPETKGRELPTEISDIELWYTPAGKRKKTEIRV
ncbi:hypothetical protein BaRGS_00012703 [Batillaria attramentaria]|uniref:Major facilitator superfamily (MFS) profile domain-containing protein n=1 Tax=Batillaria attramentaria TaxID=370345 RepID=A0ABD0LA44_9CAEN